MAPHLSVIVLGQMQVLLGRGRTPIQIRDALAAQRARRGVGPLDLTTVWGAGVHKWCAFHRRAFMPQTPDPRFEMLGEI